MAEKQPIIIRRGTFVGTLYDVGSLMELPLANTRKLWKIMLDAADENEETIATVRAWLPQAVAEAKSSIPPLEEELTAAKRDAEAKRRTVAAMGTILMERITITKRELARAKKKRLPAEKLATYQEAYDRALRPKTEHQLAEKEVTRIAGALKAANAAHEQAKKLQTIFAEMAAKAKL